MKRSLLATLIIGALVTAIVSILHAKGFLFRPEFAVTEFISQRTSVTELMAGRWQYFFIAISAFGVAWMTLHCLHRGVAAILVVVLLLELVAGSWVCALYQIFFQPLPSLFATVLSFVLALGFTLAVGNRSRRVSEIFAGHLSPEAVERVVASDYSLEAEATSHEATVIVCDIAHKHELTEDHNPQELAQLIDQFVRFATEIVLSEGAYVQAADGEGVVAMFGFPVANPEHASNATRTALRMVTKFDELRKTTPEVFGEFNLHLGLSSGTMISMRFQQDHQVAMVPVGEPLELARRFCLANRYYGSRILLGPETFALAEQQAVARPIDFLSGATARERLEVYELLAMAETAKAEDVARRDSFWTGVVYYREKRWGEAYSEFQRAWGENGQEDAPLQLYLRRLEPLVLNLRDAPPAGEMQSP